LDKHPSLAENSMVSFSSTKVKWGRRLGILKKYNSNV